MDVCYLLLTFGLGLTDCPLIVHPVLKGTVLRDFLLLVFSWISFPQAPEYTIRAVSKFFENSRRYSQLKVDHRYQRHQWQILPPVSLVLLIQVANLPPVSTIPTANLPPVSTTPVANCQRYQRHRRQICHRCQRHRWQTTGLISGCRYLKVNLKAKMFIFVNSTIQRCPNKIIKIFWLKIFFICHRCQRHRWSTLSCEYLREFSKKFETVLLGYSGAGGKLIDEKNQKQKISWHCPFNKIYKYVLTTFWIYFVHIWICIPRKIMKSQFFHKYEGGGVAAPSLPQFTNWIR